MNFDLYTTVSDPLRNYADLVVMRQIKFYLNYLSGRSFDGCELDQVSVKNLLENEFNYDSLVDYLNEKILNRAKIFRRFSKLFIAYILKERPSPVLDAIVVDIGYKPYTRGRRNISGIFEPSTSLTLTLFIPSLNVDIEWRKEDNPEVKTVKFNQSESSLICEINSKSYDNGLVVKAFKLFTEVVVNVNVVDSIPIDLKCDIIGVNT